MKNLKLNNLVDSQLTKKEMSYVVGGAKICGCGCIYAGSGGSSTDNNGWANNAGGLTTPNCRDLTWYVSELMLTGPTD